MVKKHFIFFGGVYDVTYIVYVNGSQVEIYQKNNKEFDFKFDKNLKKWRKNITPFYDVLVAKYKVTKIFTNDGVILLQLSNNKYVYVGGALIEFTTDTDKISRFYAPIPGSYPSPVAFGEKYAYFMIDIPITKVPIKYFENISKKERETNAYSYYYGINGVNIKLQQYSSKVKKQKRIRK